MFRRRNTPEQPEASDGQWITARACSSNTCVEAKLGRDGALLRDGKEGDASAVLEFDPTAWGEFVGAAIMGGFRIVEGPNGSLTLSDC